MNNAGYATVTLDLIGTGQSSKPLSATVTETGQAAAVHQVIQALRSGHLGGESFDTVVMGGHSLGSTVVLWEAASYHDANTVFLTGFSHYPVLTLGFTSKRSSSGLARRPAELHGG
jgi:pimeloyl-ACP methyl ester carboxylesterase